MVIRSTIHEVIAMSITIKINDWNKLCEMFHLFFKDLGKIDENQEYIQFESYPENVVTSFLIRKNGIFAASMPLHGLEGGMSTVTFNHDDFSVIVEGVDTTYTYRVPKELINLRD